MADGEVEHATAGAAFVVEEGESVMKFGGVDTFDIKFTVDDGPSLPHALTASPTVSRWGNSFLGIWRQVARRAQRREDASRSASSDVSFLKLERLWQTTRERDPSRYLRVGGQNPRDTRRTQARAQEALVLRAHLHLRRLAQTQKRSQNTHTPGVRRSPADFTALTFCDARARRHRVPRERVVRGKKCLSPRPQARTASFSCRRRKDRARERRSHMARSF